MDHAEEGAGLSNPKLCDLGDVVKVQPDTNHIIGAAPYRAPEVLLTLPWTVAVDIWSFGATASYNDNS